MEDALMEAAGLNAKVLLLRDVVRVRPVGLRSVLSGASKIEKDILISQIVSIQFKRAGLLSNGYLELVMMHGQEKRDKGSDYDMEDTVVTFRPGQQMAFEAFREMLESRITGGAVKAPSAATSHLDELDKLASLRDRGVITEEEFSRKKKQLLGL